ncbi:hypothetical protein FOXYS1_13893 [Fusarium oxysporum]|uniref:Alpha/beta hydrolase fold-3 domain-containing protein n=1 Tax=Fusarium oxysporum TaxID=5507 RepID=A0A8H5ECW9_FUSOX|nr:hypothetical protein FOXYS1_13893 [Fusarium oxysporum]
MAPQFNPNHFSRFVNFDIFETVYKVVRGHEIACHVLVQRHFFSPWHLQLASRHEAVIVSCDYSLAPEATLGEIIADIDDFLTWTRTKLPEFISGKAKIQLDTTRILAAGDSAGGYLSLITGLNPASEVRAVTASYPLVDAKSRHFTEAYEKPMFGFPQMPASLIDEHKVKLKNGEIDSIISADPQVQCAALMFSYIQNGKFEELIPLNRRDLSILDIIEDGARFSRGGVFVWHGIEDSIVPVEGSVKLADKIKELDPDLAFTLAVCEGDRGFDATSSIDEAWFSEGLKPLVSAWLA